MFRELTFNQTQFDLMLKWLGDDRDAAGKKYEEIRENLIRLFTWRGCYNAEELSDEVINRVTVKIEDLLAHYEGDPARYFYGVAKKLLLENQRKQRLQTPLPEVAAYDPGTPEEHSALELIYECMAACMKELKPAESSLIVSYYAGEKQEKIRGRKGLAWQSGVAPNTLRVRVYRIRETLEKCIKRCVNQGK